VVKTLLAVDDSVTMRKILEITFRGEDFHVVTADCTDAALRADESADAFVVDAVLGSEDGYALAKELRRRHPSSAIVMLSSRHTPYDPAKGRDAGADDFADKPFDTQQLLDKVRKAASSRESRVMASAPPSGEPVAPPAPSFPAPTAARTPVEEPASMRPAASAAPPPATPPVSVVPSDLGASLQPKLESLGLTADQVAAVLALSREVVERVVWEVVPQLAETMIQEEIARLTKD
jgi:CheY-like chemotaxis protein